MLALVLNLLTTLPADNGGRPTYGVGDRFSGGTVLCTDFSNASSLGNYTLRIAPEAAGAAMIVFALQPSDLFTQNMASAQASLDAFLHSDAVGLQASGGTSYLFLAHGPDDAAAAAATAAFRARLVARVAGTNLSLGTLSRMHFGAQRASSVAGLGPILEQWTTPINSMRVVLEDGSAMNISRLDGKYAECTWLSEDAVLPPLVDGGSGCQPLDLRRFAGKTVVVRSDGCSQEQAVRMGGNIVIAANGTLPVEVAHCREGAFATVISSEDGAALLAALGGSKQRQLPAALFSRRLPGAYAAIDSAGSLQEVGWQKYSTLQSLAWAAQYLDYLTGLKANLSKAHFSIPITGWHGNRANISLPPARLLRTFSSMEIENALSCSDAQGRMDQSCPTWDHNVALGVACAATFGEAVEALDGQLASQPRRVRTQDAMPDGPMADGATRRGGGRGGQQQRLADSEGPQRGVGEPGGFAGELVCIPA